MIGDNTAPIFIQIKEKLKDYKNNEMLAIRIAESWYSIEDFFDYSKAFLAVSEKEIVGVIFGSASLCLSLAVRY